MALFHTGFYSIGTDVDNLDETLETLRKHGCDPISPIIPTSVGKQVFILDLNGVKICLIEHSPEYRKQYMDT